MPTREGNAMFTLHRYFLTASTMRKSWTEWMRAHPEGPFADDQKHFPEWLAHLSMWYVALVTTWEGWNRLAVDFRLHNADLDALWADSLRPLLQGYRNATLHYDRRYLDSRMTEFVSDPDAATFAFVVHDALGDAILAELTRLSEP